MKTLLVLISIVITNVNFSYELYSKSFGSATDPAVIFMHGGPGYNSASFEITTAQQLADKGFYVIVYDRSGEGRSFNPKAKHNFKSSFKDVKALYKSYQIEKSTIIGHSFGGILATKFASKFPAMVDRLILVGAPVSIQESFKTIIQNSRKIYTARGDKQNLNYLAMLDRMDSTSLNYATYCFSHAMQNNFYTPANPTEEAKQLYRLFKSDSTLIEYASEMTSKPTIDFWKKEDYTTIDLTATITNLKAQGIPIYGIYGKEDGLYSSDQIARLKQLIGAENVTYFENCSHSVFIDQQTLFINTIQNLIKN